MNQRLGLRTLGWAIDLLSVTLAIAVKAHADCENPPLTEQMLTVQHCRVVDPYAERRLLEFVERYPKAFVGSDREPYRQEAQEIVESYRGAVLEGTTADGSTSPYFYPSKDPKVCRRFPPGLHIEVQVASACCDGDPNPPCYLGFGHFIVSRSEKLTNSLKR